MGTGAITVVLVFLLVALSWQTIISANRDLVRRIRRRRQVRRDAGVGGPGIRGPAARTATGGKQQQGSGNGGEYSHSSVHFA